MTATMGITAEPEPEPDPAATLTADPTAALIAGWRSRIAGRGLTVALADGADPRAIQAAQRLHSAGDLRPLLVGDPDRIRSAARKAAITVSEELILDPAEIANAADVQRALANRPESEHTDPLVLAVAALRTGRVDACVAGATRPTADVLRAGIRVLGLQPEVDTVSSSFLMILPDGRAMAFGDCAVVPDPDASQLADIAVASARTYRALLASDPVVAMLSFSTQGSATHPAVTKVRASTELLRTKGIVVDGELQFDAAVVDTVASVKAPESAVAGKANVLVFPNLDAGNIGYKITERIGGATAIGPILQGLAKPLNDLSRGCSSRDIELLTLISAVQSL